MAEGEISTSPGNFVGIEALRTFLSQFPETQKVSSEYDQRADYWRSVSLDLRGEVEKGNIDWEKYDQIVGQLVAVKEWLADHDLLTGLANRRAFDEVLANKLSESSAYNYPLTLAFLDFNNFKLVNTKLGHVEGNHLLTAIGHILKENMRPGWMAARIGGDEIAIIMAHTNSEQAVLLIDELNQKLEAVTASEKLKSLPEPFGISFGKAQWDGIESKEYLEKRADSDMYRVKNINKNG